MKANPMYGFLGVLDLEQDMGMDRDYMALGVVDAQRNQISSLSNLTLHYTSVERHISLCGIIYKNMHVAFRHNMHLNCHHLIRSIPHAPSIFPHQFPNLVPTFICLLVHLVVVNHVICAWEQDFLRWVFLVWKLLIINVDKGIEPI